MVIYASVQIFRGIEPLLSWIGLELTALSLIPFFVSYQQDTSRVSRARVLAYTLVSGLGLAICMTISYRYQQVAGITHILAGATFIAWVGFMRLYVWPRHAGQTMADPD